MNQPLRLKRYANGQAALPESNAQARVWVTEYVASIDSLSARWNDGDHTRQRPADLLREFGEDDEAFWLRMVTWLHANPANPFASLADAAPEAPAQAGNAADVAARLVRELRDGTADKDPQAWMREAALTMQRLAPEAARNGHA